MTARIPFACVLVILLAPLVAAQEFRASAKGGSGNRVLHLDFGLR